MKITLNGTVAAGQVASVYVRLFDVDDPTAFDDAVDPGDEPANIYYPIDQWFGGDNRDLMPFEPPPLTATAGQDTITHEYTFPSLRAGDNYRAFASTNQSLVNNMTINRDVENGRSQVNPFRSAIAPFDVPPKKLSSVTLALWRYLYLEVDKMQPGTIAENRHDGAVVAATYNAVANETTFRLPVPHNDFHGIEQFEFGWIQVFGQADAHEVRSSTLTAGGIDVVVALDRTLTDAGNTVVGNQASVYDDDIDWTAGAGFSYKVNPTLPDTSELTASLKEAFFVPLIDTTANDGLAFENNTSDALISFERNLEDFEAVDKVNADRQYPSSWVSDGFITAHVVGSFQGRATSDRDGPFESSVLGQTASVGAGAFLMGTLIHKEVIREFPLLAESRIVVHEIGHLFQRPGEDFHTHGGVMDPAIAINTSRYAAQTLERIRSRDFMSP